MTPKEKSWDLFNKYRTLEGKFGDKVLYNYDAKQCALIAVNEILNWVIVGTYDYESLNEFWQEVKTEINKL